MPTHSDMSLILTGGAIFVVLSLLYTMLKNLSEKQENNLLDEYGDKEPVRHKKNIFPYIIILLVVVIMDLLIYKYM